MKGSGEGERKGYKEKGSVEISWEEDKEVNSNDENNRLINNQVISKDDRKKSGTRLHTWPNMLNTPRSITFKITMFGEVMTWQHNILFRNLGLKSSRVHFFPNNVYEWKLKD